MHVSVRDAGQRLTRGRGGGGGQLLYCRAYSAKNSCCALSDATKRDVLLAHNASASRHCCPDVDCCTLKGSSSQLASTAGSVKRYCLLYFTARFFSHFSHASCARLQGRQLVPVGHTSAQRLCLGHLQKNSRICSHVTDVSAILLVLC